MYVKEYMNTNIVTVDSNTLINDADKLMHDHKIRRLPVIHKGKLVGLITRGRIREINASKTTSLSIWELNYLISKMKVKDVMVTDLFTVDQDTPLEDAIIRAQEREVGTVLVVDKAQPSKLVGIATTTDLYKLLTTILGYGRKGARLHIFEPSKVGSCAEAVGIIIAHGLNILSLFHVTPPGLGIEDCIIHLETDEANEIVEKLREKGFKVEQRTHRYTSYSN